jgi:nucleotide-binding universal stress UspA family protein
MDPIKNILAPTDLSALSAKGLEYAGGLAKRIAAQVTVCHVVRTEEFVAHARLLEKGSDSARAEDQLAHLVDQHRQLLHDFVDRHLRSANADLVIAEIVEMGEPHRLIIDCIKPNAIDLIVMSTHGRSGLQRMMLGSVTEKVLRNAHCPVLVIPPEEK